MGRQPQSLNLDKAKAKFIVDIYKAKANGVDVAGIFVEVQEQIILAWVRAFGLVLGILWVFLSPMAVLGLKVFCAQNHLDIEIPEDMVYWICAVGIVSILAFGFDLVDPRSLLRGRHKDRLDTSYLTQSGKYRAYTTTSDLLFKPQVKDDDNQEGEDGAV